MIRLDRESACSVMVGAGHNGRFMSRPAVLLAGFVEAARIQGGQPLVPFIPAGDAKFVLDTESETVYY